MAAMNHQRLIQGSGTAEPAWQAWLQSGGISTCALEDWLPRKQAALAAHDSQLHPSERSGGAVLGAAIVARASRAYEYFFVEPVHAHAAC